MLFFENNGSGTFTKNEVATVPYPMCMYPIELDNDSDTDIIASGSSNLYYLLNDGSQNFTKYEFASVAGNNHFQSLYPVDFDEDSDIDIIYATDADVIINGYENDCSENLSYIISIHPLQQAPSKL